MTLRIFEPAPDLVVETTAGRFGLRDWAAGRWTVLLSVPFDFTPVCTTELAAFASREDEFTERDAALIVTSADDLDTHQRWRADIARVFGVEVGFPMIADTSREVARAFGMITESDPVLPVRPGRWLVTNPDFAVRTLFVLRPAHTVAATISYPPNIGLSVDEVLRVLDGLRLGRHKLATPADWQQGDEVVVGRVLSDEMARAKFGHLREATPYLRYTEQPGY